MLRIDFSSDGEWIRAEARGKPENVAASSVVTILLSASSGEICEDKTVRNELPLAASTHLLKIKSNRFLESYTLLRSLHGLPDGRLEVHYLFRAMDSVFCFAPTTKLGVLMDDMLLPSIKSLPYATAVVDILRPLLLYLVEDAFPFERSN